MTDSHPWSELVSTALVGTNRRGVPETPGLPPVGGDDPALVLLDRVALLVARERAGRLPGRAEPLPPAPPETAPVVPAAAGRRLHALVRRGDGVLLTEWLDLAAARGRRVPPEELPALLDLGTRDSSLRPAIARATGERGPWLARLNPRWRYLESTLPVETFTVEEWREERAERRRALLESLDPHLSPADEPLLNEALTDRSARVRGLARTLLARLPEAEHSQRLAAHARRHIRTRDDGRPVVHLPDLGDADLARDLDMTPPSGGDPRREVRREWLWTLVSHAPLDTWIGHLGADRDAVVRAASAAGDWDLLDTLANAAVVQASREWARVLIPTVLNRLTRGHDMRGSRGPTLLALLPAEEQCAWALLHARGSGGPTPQSLQSTVVHLECAWTLELGEAVAGVIRDALGSDTAALTGLCRVAAKRMPPELHTRFDAIDPTDDRCTEAMASLVTDLRFRFEMHEELA